MPFMSKRGFSLGKQIFLKGASPVLQREISSEKSKCCTNFTKACLVDVVAILLVVFVSKAVHSTRVSVILTVRDIFHDLHSKQGSRQIRRYAIVTDS